MKVKNKVKERKDSNERERESFFLLWKECIVEGECTIVRGKEGDLR